MTSKTFLSGDIAKREYNFKQVILILLIFSAFAFVLGFAFGEAHGWMGCINYGIQVLENSGFVFPPEVMAKLLGKMGI